MALAKRFHPLRIGGLSLGITAAGIGLIMLTVPAVPAAATPAAVAKATPAAAAQARPASPAPALLTQPQAAARARATGKAVVVTSMTTAASQTTVSPDGRFTTTESLAPVRAERGGRWYALSPALHHAAGGRLATAMTPDDVSLSGGGRAPLAVLANYGRTLKISWPGRLPAPQVSGATATYPDVPVRGADLIVTVSPEGTVSTVVKVTNAAAAASPALAALTMTAVAPGLTLSADRSGGLEFRAEPAAAPVFTAPAPRMWDSAPLPAGSPTTTDPSSGELLAVPSGLPATSSVNGPGGDASVTPLPVTVSGNTITLRPPARALTGRHVRYPLYIDPAFTKNVSRNASAWTQIDSGAHTDASNWKESGCLNGNGGPCLQTGYCDPTGPNMSTCGGIGVTRTMFQFALPNLPPRTVVWTANIDLENVWTAACSAQPLQLWTTPTITSSTDWDNAHTWNSEEEEETFNGYGAGPPCGPGPNDVIFGTDSGTKTGVQVTGGSEDNLADTLMLALSKNQASQTFGLRAPNESTTPASQGGTAYLQWRQFKNTASSIALEFTWSTGPDDPSNLWSDPGGACHANAAHEAQIGNDDITLSATASDSDKDPGLTTTFEVYAFDNNNLEWSKAVSGTGRIDAPTIPRATIQSWQPNGSTSAYRYYYDAWTENQDGQTSSTTGPCYFFYNPTGPSAPVVTGFPGQVSLGQTITGVTFAPGGGATCTTTPPPSTCPATYTYQIGDLAPVTVNANGANATWTGNITIPVFGPFDFSVNATNGVGNPGEPHEQFITSKPQSPLPDGYFSGGTYPDVLFTRAGKPEPSLWLARGTGNGTVGAPLDIGSLGNTINPGSDGPADWTGATILHGDFTSHEVQDILAYWPSATTIGTATIPPGTGSILGGFGAGITVDPDATFWGSGNQYDLNSSGLCDQMLDGCASRPADLVGAGNASQIAGTAGADLLGILCSQNTPLSCELNIYIAAAPGSYVLDQPVSDASHPAPDGTSDWNNYSLATAELPDTSTGTLAPDPANIAVLALNNATGQLYESVNSGCPANCAGGELAGSPGTWTPVTGTTWGSNPPGLLSADSKNSNGKATGRGLGNIELWTRSGSTVTAYTITTSGSTISISPENSGSIAVPGDEWPLTDGDHTLGGTLTTPATATDTDTFANAATIGGTFDWAPDPTFRTVLDTTGAGYLTPPPTTFGDNPTSFTLSLWFKTTTADGVLASLQKQAVTSGNTIPGGYDPLLYVGNDGHLHGQVVDPSGESSPLDSSTRVDDGLWHQATFTCTSQCSTQQLYVDGQLESSIFFDPANSLATQIGATTNLTFGTGYIGGPWPNNIYNKKTSTLDNFNGQIADITIAQ
jgi:hypothetical protein